jgi:hypothetical protein
MILSYSVSGFISLKCLQAIHSNASNPNAVPSSDVAVPFFLDSFIVFPPFAFSVNSEQAAGGALRCFPETPFL